MERREKREILKYGEKTQEKEQRREQRRKRVGEKGIGQESCMKFAHLKIDKCREGMCAQEAHEA